MGIEEFQRVDRALDLIERWIDIQERAISNALKLAKEATNE